MTWGRAFLAVFISSFGCAPQAPVLPPAPPESLAVQAEPTPPKSAPEPTTEEPALRLPIEFEPSPGFSLPDEAIPHLEIKSPILGKAIPVEGAANYVARFKANPWSAELKLVLALDDFPPRTFDDPSKPVRLGELVPANRELEPGAHRLFAAVELPDGTTARPAMKSSLAPFAFTAFWIGPDETGRSPEAMAAFDAPLVILLSPRGTFNGNQAADEVLLDYHVLHARIAPEAFRVKLQVLASGERHETSLADAGVVRISGLPSGDHGVSLQLLTPNGAPSKAPYAFAKRTITVNRDAPVE